MKSNESPKLIILDNMKPLDWWNKISAEEKKAIIKGLKDIKAGKVRPHREVKKLYEKWL